MPKWMAYEHSAVLAYFRKRAVDDWTPTHFVQFLKDNRGDPVYPHIPDKSYADVWKECLQTLKDEVETPIYVKRRCQHLLDFDGLAKLFRSQAVSADDDDDSSQEKDNEGDQVHNGDRKVNS